MNEFIPLANTLVADVLTWTVVAACLIVGRS